MVTLTVRRIGSSLGVILPREAAKTLNVGEGDQLILTETPDGMKITSFDEDFARQIQAAEKCIRKYRNALRELAIQATILEKNQEAFELWHRLLALNPEPNLAAIAYVNLGTIYCRLEKFNDALDAAKKAVECSPKLKEAQYNLAMAELHCGNAQNTISILESLLNGFADYPPAQFILSAAYCCADQKEKGLDGIRKLKNTPLGAHLEMPCIELSQSLLAAKKVQFSLWVLGAAIECDIVNKEILDLFSECIKMNDQAHKLSTIPPTGPTGRQLALFEDLPQ